MYLVAQQNVEPAYGKSRRQFPPSFFWLILISTVCTLFVLGSMLLFPKYEYEQSVQPKTMDGFSPQPPNQPIVQPQDNLAVWVDDSTSMLGFLSGNKDASCKYPSVFQMLVNEEALREIAKAVDPAAEISAYGFSGGGRTTVSMSRFQAQDFYTRKKERGDSITLSTVMRQISKEVPTVFFTDFIEDSSVRDERRFKGIANELLRDGLSIVVLRFYSSFSGLIDDFTVDGQKAAYGMSRGSVPKNLKDSVLYLDTMGNQYARKPRPFYIVIVAQSDICDTITKAIVKEKDRMWPMMKSAFADCRHDHNENYYDNNFVPVAFGQNNVMEVLYRTDGNKLWVSETQNAEQRLGSDAPNDPEALEFLVRQDFLTQDYKTLITYTLKPPLQEYPDTWDTTEFLTPEVLNVRRLTFVELVAGETLSDPNLLYYTRGANDMRKDLTECSSEEKRWFHAAYAGHNSETATIRLEVEANHLEPGVYRVEIGVQVRRGSKDQLTDWVSAWSDTRAEIASKTKAARQNGNPEFYGGLFTPDLKEHIGQLQEGQMQDYRERAVEVAKICVDIRVERSDEGAQ